MLTKVNSSAGRRHSRFILVQLISARVGVQSAGYSGVVCWNSQIGSRYPPKRTRSGHMLLSAAKLLFTCARVRSPRRSAIRK